MLKCPKSLDPAGRAFWRRHHRHCIDNGSLTEVTASAFELLCRVWSLMDSTDPHEDSREALKFCGLLKQAQALAKPFGLLGAKPPAPKPRASIGDIIKAAISESPMPQLNAPPATKVPGAL